ncbi:hypothetical protein [Paenibacillus sp. GCM10027626]|uniref:hypothetical protein n=1 Tax=Paenibacillus sp. GCM10027626 TaxID=3273411 RepID=UPI00363717E3
MRLALAIEVLRIRSKEKLNSFHKLNDFMKYGGFTEIPENKPLTFNELLLACHASSRSEKGIRLDFEFQQCDLTIIYHNNHYYGSRLDFSRLGRISSKDKILKSCDVNFWSNFESYATAQSLKISKTTQTKNSIRATLSNGLRVAFHFSKDHDDFLISEITSRFGNKRIMNAALLEPFIIEMESMNISLANYLKHGGFFNLPGNGGDTFNDLLLKCSSKESHSGISGTILGFNFKNWLLEVFYDDDQKLIGENVKFVGNHNNQSKEDILKGTEINFWGNFKTYAEQIGLQMIEICTGYDTIIAFLNSGSNVHFQYQEEYGDYVVCVLEGEGTEYRESYRRIYTDELS